MGSCSCSLLFPSACTRLVAPPGPGAKAEGLCHAICVLKGAGGPLHRLLAPDDAVDSRGWTGRCACCSRINSCRRSSHTLPIASPLGERIHLPQDLAFLYQQRPSSLSQRLFGPCRSHVLLTGRSRINGRASCLRDCSAHLEAMQSASLSRGARAGCPQRTAVQKPLAPRVVRARASSSSGVVDKEQPDWTGEGVQGASVLACGPCKCSKVTVSRVAAAAAFARRCCCCWPARHQRNANAALTQLHSPTPSPPPPPQPQARSSRRSWSTRSSTRRRSGR